MRSKGHLYKFLVYLVVVVLVNIVGMTLFFRMDLTANRIFTLSEPSRQAVATLAEPLTVKVFFSRNLPAPHNNTERYLQDLLAEYALAGNRYFNFQTYDVSNEATDSAGKNKDLAESYGIFPVQLENLQQDEFKIQRAYMGMVMIHGDVVEKIPTILSTDGLEYQITSRIQKLNNKISALTSLKENIAVELFLSTSLYKVGPYMNLNALSGVKAQMEKLVGELNDVNYGKLDFFSHDPSSDPAAAAAAESHGLLRMRWQPFTDPNGQTIAAGEGVAGLVVRHGERLEPLPLIRVMRLPIFGTTYQMVAPEELREILADAINAVIDVNAGIGYLASHSTLPLAGGGGPMQGGPAAANFNRILSEVYSVKPVDLETGAISESLDTLVIAGPKKEFSDWDLYQLDQYLMKGKNLAIFLDPFEEKQMGGQAAMMMGRQMPPQHLPLDTGLEKLLAHYGVAVEKAYVLDESSFEQRIPQQFGGGKRQIYYAPVVKQESINSELSFMHNIKGLVALKAAPLNWVAERIEAQALSASKIFSSSPKSWKMKAPINLNPMTMMPPADDGEFEPSTMGVLLKGRFDSYFAGKPIPEKPESKDPSEAPTPGKEASTQEKSDPSAAQTVAVNADERRMDKGAAGRILLFGTSELISDAIVDEQGRGPNAQLVLNGIDYLNGREGFAQMRSKTQQYNPLMPVEPAVRTFVKAFNIGGLPVLVVLVGIFMWMHRAAKKRRIQAMFSRAEG